MSDLSPGGFAGAQPLSVFRPWFASTLDASLGTSAPGDVAESAYADGFAAGRQAAENEFRTERRDLQGLIAASACFQPEPSDDLAKLIATAVEQIVRTIVGEVAIDAEALMVRIARAAKAIGDTDSNRTLFLHPEDARLLDHSRLSLSVASDINLERGSLRIEHSSGSIEDGIATLLVALREQLGIEGDAR